METRKSQYEHLVRTLSGDLYRFAYWLARDDATAKDVVQETLIRAWRALDDLRDLKAAKAWLMTIVRREHARLFERKRLDIVDVDQAHVEDSAPSLYDQSQVLQLRRAIAQLEPKYREPLVMQVLGGYSCAEIATALGITEAAVMTQVFRARQKLKQVLDGQANPTQTQSRGGSVHELR